MAFTAFPQLSSSPLQSIPEVEISFDSYASFRLTLPCHCTSLFSSDPTHTYTSYLYTYTSYLYTKTVKPLPTGFIVLATGGSLATGERSRTVAGVTQVTFDSRRPRTVVQDGELSKHFACSHRAQLLAFFADFHFTL